MKLLLIPISSATLNYFPSKAKTIEIRATGHVKPTSSI